MPIQIIDSGPLALSARVKMLMVYCAGEGLAVTPRAVATPEIVTNEGGTFIDVQFLDNVLEGEYIIHVGPLGTAADPIMYSGVPGQGQHIGVESNQFSGVAPPLPIGGPYVFTLVSVLLDVATIATLPALTVIARDFKSGSFGLRRLLPSAVYDVGSARIVNVSYPQI